MGIQRVAVRPAARGDSPVRNECTRGAAASRARTVLLAIGLAAACRAGTEVTFTPSLRLSYFSGYTQYEFGGRDAGGDWLSRLRFPINNMRVDPGVGVTIDRLVELSISGWTTLDREAGTLKDDDFTNGVRDVWSRSRAELDAWGINGRAAVWALRGKTYAFGPTLGAVYDRLDYDVYDVRQWGLDPGDSASVDGLVLTYRQERLSFPMGLALRWRPVPWWGLEWSAAASVFTYVWDRDDHVLRYKLSESEALAFFMQSTLNVDFILWDRVRLGAWGDIAYLHSWWGEQDQHFYAGPQQGLRFNDIETEITRLTYLVGARFTVDF